MVTEKEYLEAKELVKKYGEIMQCYEIEEKIKRQTEQHLREGECEKSTHGHHFIPTNAKWQPITQSECCFCGKVIE